MTSRPTRILAVQRHPTPYRDPLLDRIAALPGLDLEVQYLGEGFAQTPWDRGPLGHAHRFPRGFLRRRVGDHEIAFHPGVLTRLASFRPDACVLAGWFDPSMLVLAAACRAIGCPYVLGGESWEESGRSRLPPRTRRAVLRWVMQGASAWLPCGSRARTYFVARGADPGRCHYFPTSPDARWWRDEVDAVRRREPDLRRALGLPDDEVVTFVGRLVEDKAPEVLLDAFELLQRRRPAAQLVLVGDGPLLASLRSRAAGAHVTFAGFAQPRDVARLLAASDVLALPSRYETWGAVACEAMAAGLPVVLSDRVGCAPDVVGDGGPGRMVPVGDAAALAEALDAVLADPDRRRGLPERARRRSLEWGHDLNVRSFVLALRDAGARVDDATLAAASRAAP